MKVESIAEARRGAFCNTYDLHLAIIDVNTQFLDDGHPTITIAHHEPMAQVS